MSEPSCASHGPPPPALGEEWGRWCCPDPGAGRDPPGDPHTICTRPQPCRLFFKSIRLSRPQFGREGWWRWRWPPGLEWAGVREGPIRGAPWSSFGYGLALFLKITSGCRAPAARAETGDPGLSELSWRLQEDRLKEEVRAGTGRCGAGTPGAGRRRRGRGGRG